MLLHLEIIGLVCEDSDWQNAIRY